MFWLLVEEDVLVGVGSVLVGAAVVVEVVETVVFWFLSVFGVLAALGTHSVMLLVAEVHMKHLPLFR